MIIFQEKLQDEIKSIIDLRNDYPHFEKTKKLIFDYIFRSRQYVFLNEKKTEVFQVSGLAESHSRDLCEYLNNFAEYSSLETATEAVFQSGYFSANVFHHYWIEVGPILVDVCFSQFANKPNFQSLKSFMQNSIFISDNRQNPIYQLYKKPF